MVCARRYYLTGQVAFYKRGAGDGIRTRDVLLGKQANTLKLLNKLSVSELAELSKFSKAYISQVKHGKRPPSKRLLDTLITTNKPEKDYVTLFLQSRQSMGVSPNTFELYRYILKCLISHIDPVRATRMDIERYLLNIKANGMFG